MFANLFNMSKTNRKCFYNVAYQVHVEMLKGLVSYPESDRELLVRKYYFSNGSQIILKGKEKEARVFTSSGQQH